MLFSELKKTLNTSISNIYILEGNDEYLVNHSISLIKNACIKSFPELNFIKKDCTILQSSDIDEIITTMPFGDDKRVVALYNAVINPAFSSLLQQNNNQNNVVVILVHPQIIAKNNFLIIDCNILDRGTLVKWIENELQKNKISIEAQAINKLIALGDGKLQNISPELEKIINYSGDNKKITEKNVADLMHRDENYYVYNMTAEYEKNNTAEMMKIMQSLTESDNLQQIFSALGSYFRRMCYSAISDDSDEVLAKYLNIKPYAVKKSRDAIKSIGKEKFVDKYQQFVELDEQIKLGKTTPSNGIYLLLLTK